MSTVINKKKIELVNCLNPDYVFIPFRDDFKLNIDSNNQRVYKESVLQERDGSVVLSPVSGSVVGTKAFTISDGTSVKCIAIVNDFKEQYKTRQGIRKKKNFNREEIIEILKNKNVVSSSYLNLNIWNILEEKQSPDTLLVSGVELDASLLSNSYILQEHVTDILDTIDILSDALGVKKIFLVLSNTDDNTITRVSEFIGTYPKIELRIISGKYPMGLEHVLRKEICGKKTESNDVIFFGVADILAIHTALIRNKHVNEKIITINGNMVASPVLINVKIGSLLSPIIKKYVNIKPLTTKDSKNDKELIYITNDVISGNVIPIDSLIVTPDLRGIVINEKTEIKSKNCLNCGKCHESCPLNINPKYIMENYNNPEKLKLSRIEKCIKCGLCSYTCSAKINLKPFLIGRGNNEN